MLRGATHSYTSQFNYHHEFAFTLPYPTAVSAIELTAPPAEAFEVPAEVALFGETPEGEEVILHDGFPHHLFAAGIAVLPVASPIPLRRVRVVVSSGCVGVE